MFILTFLLLKFLILLSQLKTIVRLEKLIENRYNYLGQTIRNAFVNILKNVNHFNDTIQLLHRDYLVLL